MPKSHPVAVEMRKYYQELKWWYGNEGFVRLYREGNLYNFYVKKTGASKKVLDAVTHSSKCSGNKWQAVAKVPEP